MIRLLRFRPWPVFFAFAMGCLVFLQAKPAAAQAQDFGYVDVCADEDCEIEVTALILSSTNSSEIDTYSETDIDPILEEDCADYSDFSDDDVCFAYLEVYLEQNNAVIDGPYDDSDEWDPFDPPGSAIIELEDPVVVGDTYTLVTGGGYVGCDYDDEGDLDCDGGNVLLWLNVTIGTNPPSISSISPNYGYVSTTGTITVDGNYLTDDFNNPVTPAITGSGVTLTVESQSLSEVVLNYSITDGATTGAQSLTLQTSMGTSNAVTFNVYDPTPVVSSVSPSTWYAGTNTAITITGTGFGTSPSLSITGPGVTGSSISSSSDTQITGNVTIDPSSPGGTATVTVQSNGFGGSGFLGGSGQSNSGSNNSVQIVAVTLPNPQILMEQNSADQGNCDSGSVLSGQQSVYAGQEMLLTGCVSGLPQGMSITSQTWSVQNQADLSGGYSASNNSGQESSDPPMTNVSSVTFYWVNPNSTESVTYQYCVNNSTQCPSISVPFNIQGPTGYGVPGGVTVTAGSVVAAWVTNPANNNFAQYLTILGVNTGTGTAGIEFQTNGTLPAGNAGQYSWVQLLDNDTASTSGYYNRGACTAGIVTGTPVLDTGYPYSATLTSNNIPNAIATDNPFFTLQLTFPNGAYFGEAERFFTATMYLMWTPTAGNGCADGSACTVPIPLGSVNWNLTEDGINTMNPIYYQTTHNGQNYSSTYQIQQCSYPLNNGQEQPTFTPGGNYPEWSSASQQQFTCPN
jgi:hypothetical protein